MTNQILYFAFFFTCAVCTAQQFVEVSGKVISTINKSPIVNVLIAQENSKENTTTNTAGLFILKVAANTNLILSISHADFISKRMPLTVQSNRLDLGTIYLERDITVEQIDNLITLTDTEIFDDEISSNSSGILQATRDLFLSRAAFDFSQAFFRVRGYDSQYGKVLLNGIPMNKFNDGRPQWNNWGGLNDITRSQEFSYGLQASAYNFGNILGTTNIDTRPTKLRSGTRLSSSASNRTYRGRLMATYTSKQQQNGLAYSISASRRWANEGYIDGTLYDAFSLYGSVEYEFDQKSSLNLSAILVSNRRGRSSAITEEVFELTESQYNPYWGLQSGEIRNARERKIFEPILMANYYYKDKKLRLQTGVAYQFGENYRSRLGHYNAPNPDPTHYRYLPSFYINSSIGANFISAATAREGFLENPQIDWASLYQANRTTTKASYLLFDDATNDQQFTANAVANIDVTKKLQFDIGITYQYLDAKNFARIHDLLGAEYHEDRDPFSNTLNDTAGNSQKKRGEIFNYNYEISASDFNVFGQLQYSQKQWDAFAAVNFQKTNYQRNGLFQNERFLENSIGRSNPIIFSNLSLKGGFTYHLDGRNHFALNAASLNKSPTLQNSFVNPRENNKVVPLLNQERIQTIDFNYYLRFPKLTGRLTGFYTRFQNTTDVNFFFVDAGIGSDFVQEVLTDLDKLHKGFELGLEYELSPTVKLSAVAAIGAYLYANNPNVTINFDTVGAEEDLINTEGNVDLGLANIKGYRLAQGPQKALAIGINYRAPKYWWVGATANYLANNYSNISTIRHTSSFFIDPETGNPFPNATEENVNELLVQKPLEEFYLLNLVGGKSWLKKGKYISVFASINNLFNTSFRTGGFEQSRNGNFGQLQQDYLSGTPSFAPKYWYGFGRTYFLSVAYSF